MICVYGCGKEATFTLKNGKACCSSRPSGCEVLKRTNSEKLRHARASGAGGYDYHKLPTATKDKMSGKGKLLMTADEVFVIGKEWGSQLLRKYLNHYQLKEYKCISTICGITEWHGTALTLELDHISGDRMDNRLENLRWMCPNCHSQTPTFRGYNKKLSGVTKVSDEELSAALQETPNIRQALQKVGLAAKGGNYKRAMVLKDLARPK